MYIKNIENSIKNGAKILSKLSGKEKNEALVEVYKSIDRNRKNILEANVKDVENARKSNMSEPMIDRLKLDDARIDSMIEGIKTVINLKNPVGQSNKLFTLDNGLKISKISVPLGVIAIIYESRPNVTIDAFTLAFKSGNAIILRGSSSAINSNVALEKAIKDGLKNSKISEDVIHLVKDSDRNIVHEIITANGIVDLAIPRGGNSLITRVVNEATVPTLQTGEGNNHIYIDETANPDMALKILLNAKMQRVSVCNSVEKLLLHKSIANDFIKMMIDATKDKLTLRADKSAKHILTNAEEIKDEEELKKEYLDYILGVKIVDNIDEAIEHINKYGTMHSECIVTQNLENATKFQMEVDAAAVYVNASTRFTDGGEFGFGAEIGISTQKMHVRGPVGLEELVSYKYLIVGNGQVR